MGSDQRNEKATAIGCAGAIVVVGFLALAAYGSTLPDEKPKTKTKPSASAGAAPSKKPMPVMPDLAGMSQPDARTALKKAGIDPYYSSSNPIHGHTSWGEYKDSQWMVCHTVPKAGTTVEATERIEIYAHAPGRSCSDRDPEPSFDDEGQQGVQFGYACSPVGALGVAEDGRPAQCFMGRDGRPRWGYDSDRG